MEHVFFEPKISHDTRAFWAGCKQHKLSFQACEHCGKLRWPAAHFCPDCGSDGFTMREVDPHGTLHSFVVFQKPFHPSLAETVPYVAATVDLEGGIRLVSNLVHCDPAELHCGDKVVLRWADCGENVRPVFEREENGT